MIIVDFLRKVRLARHAPVMPEFPAAEGKSGPNMSRQVDPVELGRLLHQVPGKWVALHNGVIVDARDTLDALLMSLDAREITDVTVMRSPAEGEAEMVGLG